MSEDYQPFETLDLSPPVIPPRSRLNCIEPGGFETAQVESLTSYISRLAESHFVTTGTLFRCELAPLTGKDYVLKSNRGLSTLTTSFYPSTPAMNGCGQVAEDWVRIIESLTLQGSMRYLTMLPWRSVIANRAPTRPFRAWCPACIRERHESKRLYESLLWQQKFVTVCPLHRIPLEKRCPHCGKQLRPLDDRSRPGVCSSCGKLLVESPLNHHKSRSSDDCTDYQVWVAEQIGHLLANAPLLSIEPAKEEALANLRKGIEECSGNVTGFARQFGMNISTVWSWLKTNQIPHIDSILIICNQLNTSLFDFLTGEDIYSRPELKATTFTIRSEIERKLTYKDEKKVRDELLIILKEDIPASPAQAAKRLKYRSIKHFRSRFPDLFKRIEQRYYASEQYLQKVESSANDNIIKLALEKALDEEMPPSLMSIAISLEYDSITPLKTKFPDLCERINDCRAACKAQNDKLIQGVLHDALIESPPPSPYAVAKRCGYVNAYSFPHHFVHIIKKISRRYRQFRKARLRKMLKTVTSALTENPPPSQVEVAKRTGLKQGRLRELFPEQFKLISRHHSEFRSESAIRRKKEAEELVRRVALELHNQGYYPSSARIREKLPRPFILGTNEIDTLLRDIRQELGLKYR